MTLTASRYRPYISLSAINTPIPASPPIHPDSAKMISTANYWLGTGTWLGPRGDHPTGYFEGATSTLPKVTVYVNSLGGKLGCGLGGAHAVPIPTWMASVIAPNAERGDSYVLIVDSVTGDVWELYRVTPPGYASRDIACSESRWNCVLFCHWPGDTLTGKGYGVSPRGTSASKIHLAAGLLVPQDFADCFGPTDPGTVIPHALRMDTFCGARGSAPPRFVPPAEGGDGRQPFGIPCGGRVILSPRKDVTAYASVNALRLPWRWGMRKLLRTMQVYGIVQVDSTGAPGAGSLDIANAASVAHGGDGYPVGYRYPNDVAGYGWGVANGVPEEVMSDFLVVDWTRWTGA